MKRNIQRRWNASSLAILVLGFIAAVIVSDRVFQGWRIDLTENRLYTLSKGTERILDDLEEPLHLYFYFSDQVTRNIPALRDYAGRVQEVLEEFEDTAKGNLILEIIDPTPLLCTRDSSRRASGIHWRPGLTATCRARFQAAPQSATPIRRRLRQTMNPRRCCARTWPRRFRRQT